MNAKKDSVVNERQEMKRKKLEQEEKQRKQINSNTCSKTVGGQGEDGGDSQEGRRQGVA